MSYILPPLPCRPQNWKPDLAVYPCIIQPKFNGIRCLLGPDGRAWSRTAKEFPGLVDYFEGQEFWLDGEIVDRLSLTQVDAPKSSSDYLHNPDALTLQSINGLVMSHEPDVTQRNRLMLVVFDIITPGMPQFERLNTLMQLPLMSNQGMVLSKACDDWQYAKSHFDALAECAEGIIYRDVTATYQHGNSDAVLKRKKFRTKEYKCLSVHEGLGKYTGMFGGAVLELKTGQTFQCGGGNLTVADRRKLWAAPPIGKMVTVKFPYYSDDNVPLQAQIESVREDL